MPSVNADGQPLPPIDVSLPALGAPAVERGLWIAITLVVLGLLAAAGFAYRAVDRYETEQAQIRFTKAAMERLDAVRGELTLAVAILRTLGDFHAASDGVTPDRFSLVAGNAIQRYPWIKALEWVPVVADDQRDAFLTQMRRYDPAFAIVEGGARKPARRRPLVFPVSYVVPLAGNETALGLNLGFEPVRRAALDSAMRRKDIAVTDPIHLVQGGPDRSGVLVFLPLSLPDTLVDNDGGILGKTGFILAVFRLDVLIATATAHLQTAPITVTIEDITSTGNIPAPRSQHSAGSFEAEEIVPMADRLWRLRADAVSTDHLQSKSWAAPVVLAFGLSVSFLICAFLVYLVRSRSKIRWLAAQFQHSATHDALTGVANRRLLNHRAGIELAQVRRFARPFSLLLLDIDHFKSINDRHGHDAGDQALCAFATMLQGTIRETDLLARIGGEEFTILLPGMDQPQAMIMAERLRAAIAAIEINLSTARLSMTVSIGLACRTAGRDTLDALLSAADQALYRAKKEGRNRTIASPQQEDEHTAPHPQTLCNAS